MMQQLIMVTSCDNGSCCCLPSRSSVAIIAVINVIASATELCSGSEETSSWCKLRRVLKSLRALTCKFYQAANLLLLLACVVESPSLIHLYLWHSLAYVVMGLMVTLADFLLQFREEGPARSTVVFVAEVAYLFVVCRCLPLVDTFRKHLIN